MISESFEEFILRRLEEEMVPVIKRMKEYQDKEAKRIGNQIADEWREKGGEPEFASLASLALSMRAKTQEITEKYFGQ